MKHFQFRVKLLVAALYALNVLSLSQPINSAKEAEEAARDILTKLNLPHDPPQLEAEPIDFGKGAILYWNVVDDAAHYILVLASEDRSLTSFVNRSIGELIQRRDPNAPFKIKSAEEAWRFGDDFLTKCGANIRDYERQTCSINPSESARQDKNNGGSRGTLVYGQKAEGFEGNVNDITLTIDLANGQVERLSSVRGFTFDPPKSVLSIDHAMVILKGIMDRESAKFQSQGNTWYANAHAWPGDDMARSEMKLLVQRGGEEWAGSDYGKRMLESRKARVTWNLSTEGGDFAIDAENGEPFAGSVFKSTGGSGSSPKAGSMNIKKSEPNGIYLIVASIGMVGIAALAFLRFRK